MVRKRLVQLSSILKALYLVDIVIRSSRGHSLDNIQCLEKDWELSSIRCMCRQISTLFSLFSSSKPPICFVLSGL